MNDVATTESTVSAVAVQIGESIREARKGTGWTLSDVARETGLSEGFLSKIERGHANCSLANLIQICSVLGIGMDNLFSRGLASHRTNVTVHHAVESKVGLTSQGPPSQDPTLREIDSTGYKYRHLAGGRSRDDLEVIHLVFPSRAGMETLVSHHGQEHCYVLSGSIEFVVDGTVHVLNAGDGIMIDSKLPHLARNRGKTPAHVLMTVALVGIGESPQEWWSIGKS